MDGFHVFESKYFYGRRKGPSGSKCRAKPKTSSGREVLFHDGTCSQSRDTVMADLRRARRRVPLDMQKSSRCSYCGGV